MINGLGFVYSKNCLPHVILNLVFPLSIGNNESMSEKSKYTVYCLDELRKKKTVKIMANDKVKAKEQVLENHPRYKVTAVLSQDEIIETAIK